MSHVFPRHTKNMPPLALSGEGCYLLDASGKRYFDGSGGAAVSCLGHGDPVPLTKHPIADQLNPRYKAQ